MTGLELNPNLRWGAAGDFYGLESVPWSLLRTLAHNVRKAQSRRFSWGWTLLFKPLSPDRAIRQNHLLTCLLQYRIQTKEKPLFQTAINLGEQVNSVIIKMCYLGGYQSREGQSLSSPNLSCDSNLNDTKSLGSERFCYFFFLHSPIIPKKSLSHKCYIHYLINYHYHNISYG